MNAMNKAETKAEKTDMDLAEAATPPAEAPEAEARPVQKPRRKRRPLRMVLMLALPVALVAGGGYVWITGGRYEETDNAYLHQAKISITSEAAGRVTESNVTDNEPVKAGDILFTVDPEPSRIAMAEADAALAGARLKVGQLRAAYSQAKTQQSAAENEVAFLQNELDRQKTLSGKGISSKASLDTAERNLSKAKDALASAKQAVTGALAALGGNPDIETDQHPSVLAAKAARDKAAYALAQTTVRAPADGVISQASSFQTGQLVGPGQSLFTLVESNDAWVEANFKETQLTHLKPGQSAEVTFDTFPDQPVEATVASIGAGTGSEFSLIPAQNATGNWVKVTQRIPVRIRIKDNPELAKELRTGMSATVSVDTKVERGLPDFLKTATAKAGQ